MNAKEIAMQLFKNFKSDPMKIGKVIDGKYRLFTKYEDGGFAMDCLLQIEKMIDKKKALDCSYLTNMANEVMNELEKIANDHYKRNM